MSDWCTLLEIDAARGWARGSAFRAFKRVESGWAERCDYKVLHHRDDAAAIAALRGERRVYQGSVNVVMISKTRANELTEPR